MLFFLNFLKKVPMAADPTIEEETHEILMINSQCHYNLMIDYVRASVGLMPDEEFEICDAEGNIIPLRNLQPWEYPTDMFILRNHYFIVFLDSKGTNPVVYLPRGEFALRLENKLKLYLGSDEKSNQSIIGPVKSRRMHKPKKKNNLRH